jgi:L-asparaginase / beta-aspartyl-peptidase
MRSTLSWLALDCEPRLAIHVAMRSGLSLAAVFAIVACATSEEADLFQPPQRPLVYGQKDCVEPPRGLRTGPLSPTGMLPPRKKTTTLAGGIAEGLVAVVHGGVGSATSLSDGPEQAARRALEKLRQNESPLDAAIEAVVVLEDDPRFNAGTGANIRLDGKTVQMDASLMTSEGQFAAIAGIERVKNPILVARRVLETPHILLVGEGATRFAHQLGFKNEVPISKEAEAKYAERIQKLSEQSRRQGATLSDWKRYWNYPHPIPKTVSRALEGKDPDGPSDTVGAVVRDRDGRFASTLSTGGTALTLYGRVGDVPIFGAGGYAGPAGAVACTGDGEVIVKEMLAKRVYDEMASGVAAKLAVHRAVADFPPDASVGIIAVDRTGYGVAANRPMAFGFAGEEPKTGEESP